jgi:DNA-binding NarL/FixJ family response regulator
MEKRKPKLDPVKSAFPSRCARVLIVDDHPVVRRGLAALISEVPDLEVCGEAADAVEALRLVDAEKPDVAVIDISLKDGHGIDLIEQIRCRNPNVRMLVSSMHEETLYAERVLRAGAMGYVNKQETIDRLVEAIRQVLRGEIYLSSQMTERMLHRMVHGNPPEHDPIETLSNRELEVFELIGQGLTTRKIAALLHLSPKTVETYRENIKTKLNLANATELTRHAVQRALQEPQR